MVRDVPGGGQCGPRRYAEPRHNRCARPGAIERPAPTRRVGATARRLVVLAWSDSSTDLVSQHTIYRGSRAIHSTRTNSASTAGSGLFRPDVGRLEIASLHPVRTSGRARSGTSGPRRMRTRSHGGLAGGFARERVPTPPAAGGRCAAGPGWRSGVLSGWGRRGRRSTVPSGASVSPVAVLSSGSPDRSVPDTNTRPGGGTETVGETHDAGRHALPCRRPRRASSSPGDGIGRARGVLVSPAGVRGQAGFAVAPNRRTLTLRRQRGSSRSAIGAIPLDLASPAVSAPGSAPRPG